MESFNNIIKHYRDIALSDSEVLKLIDNKANLVLYPDLINYKDIDEVLGPYGACILLFEAKPNFGHWCCLFKQNNNLIEFFNSYGGYPDDSLQYIPMHFRKESNQYYPYLSWLLINSPYELSYNEHKFQGHNSDIKTCGRWAALRIYFRNLNLKQFTKLINTLCKELRLSKDDLATILTMFINNE